MDKIFTDKEILKCPFCGKGEIEITKTSEYYTTKYARAFGKIKRIPLLHPEKIRVHNACPVCKKSKNEIKEAIKKGKKPITHEDRLRLWKKRGLPLVLGSK